MIQKMVPQQTRGNKPSSERQVLQRQAVVPGHPPPQLLCALDVDQVSVAWSVQIPRELELAHSPVSRAPTGLATYEAPARCAMHDCATPPHRDALLPAAHRTLHSAQRGMPEQEQEASNLSRNGCGQPESSGRDTFFFCCQGSHPTPPPLIFNPPAPHRGGGGLIIRGGGDPEQRRITNKIKQTNNKKRVHPY